MATKRTVIRYKAKVEKAPENEMAIKAVFAELAAKTPDGVRYLVLRLADNTFIHVVSVETADGSNPVTALPAFKAFQAGVRERAAVPPESSDATIVGNYRMLGEG
jgi:hypothetical protein